MTVDILGQKRDMPVGMLEDISIKPIENEDCSMRSTFAYSAGLGVCSRNAISEGLASDHEIGGQGPDSAGGHIR